MASVTGTSQELDLATPICHSPRTEITTLYNLNIIEFTNKLINIKNFLFIKNII